jgi:SAM-dependent methyltransferase
MTGNACQICGGTAFTTLVVQRGYDWCRCTGCGLVRLREMPAADAPDPIAEDAWAEGYIDSYRARAERKFKRSLGRIRRLKRRMPGPDLLDIGSNVGFLVEAARQEGLAPVGVELNPRLVRAARAMFPECRFHEGRLEEIDFGDRRFDAAYCSEVIEHVPDCGGLLRRIAGLLRPGGVLFLTTPHVREYLRGGDPARWRDFGAPDHKLYFDDRTITRLLEQSGFTDVRIEFSFWRGLKLYARPAPRPAPP